MTVLAETMNNNIVRFPLSVRNREGFKFTWPINTFLFHQQNSTEEGSQLEKIVCVKGMIYIHCACTRWFSRGGKTLED